jgi:hypothetical protein
VSVRRTVHANGAKIYHVPFASHFRGETEILVRDRFGVVWGRIVPNPLLVSHPREEVKWCVVNELHRTESLSDRAGQSVQAVKSLGFWQEKHFLETSKKMKEIVRFSGETKISRLHFVF